MGYIRINLLLLLLLSQIINKKRCFKSNVTEVNYSNAIYWLFHPCRHFLAKTNLQIVCALYVDP